jgi:two-component system chemotaxis response regulator CheY
MGKVVLTVDDSASIRQMVAFTLKSAGYDCPTTGQNRF